MKSPLAYRFAGLVLAAWAVVTPVEAGAQAPAGPLPGRWDFVVSLDEKPIGFHRYVLSAVSGEATQLQMLSEASFDVVWLGLPLYRYRHHAVERWDQGCLVDLVSETEDDGVRTQLRAHRNGLNLDIARVRKGKASQNLLERECPFSYAYWNPAILNQKVLLNPQNGELEAVQIRPAGTEQIAVPGMGAVAAKAWHIDTPGGPVDLWLTAEGRWVGLDAQVSGGHHIRYRLA
jgi:hypothetical protein